MAKDAVLIFLHIPKTAGTTLNRIIDWEYNPLRIFSINGRYFRTSYQKLTNCPARRLARMQVFRGHMPFGLHKLLTQPATYITVLRDPVERTISEYFFAVNRKIHRQHHQISQLSLEEYVSTSPYNNAQTKLIAGQISGYDFLAGDCSAEMLAVAKQNLVRHFSFVGVTEQFEESLALAKALFGWKVRRYASFRITPRRPKCEAIPAHTRELIAEYNRFDLALYEYGVALFKEALAKHRDQVQAQIETVRRAKVVDRGELLYYRSASTALKAVSLINSALRSAPLAWA